MEFSTAFYLIACFLVAYFATTKGRSGVKAFLLALITTPLIGLLVVALLRESKLRKMEMQFERERAAQDPLQNMSARVSELKGLKDDGIISEEEYDNRIHQLKEKYEQSKVRGPLPDSLQEKYKNDILRGRIAAGIVLLGMLIYFVATKPWDNINYNFTSISSHNGNTVTKTYSNKKVAENPYGVADTFQLLQWNPLGSGKVEARIMVDQNIGYDTLKATLFDALIKTQEKAYQEQRGLNKVIILAYADERDANGPFTYGQLEWTPDEEKPALEVKEKVGRLTPDNVPSEQAKKVYYAFEKLYWDSHYTEDKIPTKLANEFGLTEDEVLDYHDEVLAFKNW
ncbi:hypothetical protein [Persicobacter sp. CCB-QB2]|uniref:hypothetical protein n=1 Tax=Persicobacter sp. CCB-QB2 TaxID=1561025 RepID=UPI0012FACF6E|nr:hypothetical protein [Persicobacter sp. CCB-QB2]